MDKDMKKNTTDTTDYIWWIVQKHPQNVRRDRLEAELRICKEPKTPKGNEK